MDRSLIIAEKTYIALVDALIISLDKELFGTLLQHEHFHLKLRKCYLSYWDLNLCQSVLRSIHMWVIKKEFVILRIEFKWRAGIHFGQNTAKNNDLFKIGFEQKLFWIQFSTKNSGDECLYLPYSGARGLQRLHFWNILMHWNGNVHLL